MRLFREWMYLKVFAVNTGLVGRARGDFLLADVSPSAVMSIIRGGETPRPRSTNLQSYTSTYSYSYSWKP